MNRKLNLLLVLIFIFVSAAYGQESVTNLKDKSITLKMEKQPLGKVFRVLMLKYDVAIGFEESVLDRDHDDYEFEAVLPSTGKRELTNKNNGSRITIETEWLFNVKKHWITVNAENTRLEDVIDIIVGQMKNYKWEINDEVINIFPSEGRDQRYEKLLSLRIKKYEVEKGSPLFVVRNNLFKLPEVTAFLSENKIHSSNLRPGSQYTRRPLSEELDFSDLTMKELLNKIAKAKRGGWILKQNKLLAVPGKEYIELSI